MTWLSPEWFWVLAALPALAVLGIIGAAATRAALRRFYGRAAARPWAGADRGATAPRLVASALALAAMGFTAVALARPATDPMPRPTQRPGRDIVFVIDVSRSMLAQDLRPSRLERAKLAARDVLDVVEGDRVGVVAFAGTAVVKCPLTTDYAFARMAIDNLSTDSVSRGGTALGDAIRTAMSQLFAEASDPQAPARVRTLVLMTDGEDQETRPIDAAREAGASGVRIVAVGLGSDLAGTPVPADQGAIGARSGGRAQYVEYMGKRVESRMDPATLRLAAEATPGGVFLNVGTGYVELDEVYRRLMRDAARSDRTEQASLKYTERFQWALLVALALFAVEGVVRVIWR